jgi:hypothetical protein
MMGWFYLAYISIFKYIFLCILYIKMDSVGEKVSSIADSAKKTLENASEVTGQLVADSQKVDNAVTPKSEVKSENGVLGGSKLKKAAESLKKAAKKLSKLKVDAVKSKLLRASKKLMKDSKKIKKMKAGSNSRSNSNSSSKRSKKSKKGSKRR